MTGRAFDPDDAVTVVLLSGGLDSATLLGDVVAEEGAVGAMTIDYGQRHERELEAAQAVADHYDVPLIRADLYVLGKLLPSALTNHDDADPIPDGAYAAPNLAATVVPNRNAILTSIAAGYASARGATHVGLAVHSGDHEQYADTRPDFLGALAHATRLATGVEVWTPFQHLHKRAIAARAVALGVPLELTWSCYRGGELHCGRCGTCVERAEALHHATGGNDPTTYTDPDYWQEAP